jgi:hypothetical protein
MRSSWISRIDNPLSARQATIIHSSIFGSDLTYRFSVRCAQRINPHGSSSSRQGPIITHASNQDECQTLMTLGSFGLNWVLRCLPPLRTPYHFPIDFPCCSTVGIRVTGGRLCPVHLLPPFKFLDGVGDSIGNSEESPRHFQCSSGQSSITST